MTPCACERTKPNGEPWRKSAYFMSVGEHSCRARRAETESRDRPAPRSMSGPPIGYPNRIYLFADTGRTGNSLAVAPGGIMGVRDDRSDKPHASTERSIRRACIFYSDSAENHGRSLWVEECAGRTYAECFVLLGTGNREIVGPLRVFYAQIHFNSQIRYGANPLIIPLFSTVNGVRRQLAIHTGKWTRDQRQDFEQRIRRHVEEGRKAHRPGEPALRPWIFFVGCEKVYDQVEFRAELHPGIESLLCRMPRQQRRFRSSAFGAMTWKTSSEVLQPASSLPNTVESDIEPSEAHPALPVILAVPGALSAPANDPTQAAPDEIVKRIDVRIRGPHSETPEPETTRLGGPTPAHKPDNVSVLIEPAPAAAARGKPAHKSKLRRFFLWIVGW